MRRKSVRTVLAVATIGAFVAGAGIPAAAQNKPVEVDVMVVASSVGGVLPLLDQTLVAVEAGAEVAAEQGVKFNISECDPKGDINVLRTCAQAAADADVDFVIAGEVSQVSAGLPEAFDEAGIPVFWVIGTTDGESQLPTSMRPTGELSNFGGEGEGTAKLGFKKDAVLVSPGKIAASVDAQLTAAYEAKGGEIIATVEAPLQIPGAPAPDYAPYAQKVVDANPKVVISNSTQILPHVRAAGFSGPFILAEGNGEAYNEQLASLPDEITQNHYRCGGNPPFDLEKPLPVVKEFEKALKAAGHTDPENVTAYGWNTWVFMNAVASVAEDMTDVTAATLLDALNTSPGIELVTGRTWVPGSEGPPDFPRQNLITYYCTKYVGDGNWKLVKTGKTGNEIPVTTFGG